MKVGIAEDMPEIGLKELKIRLWHEEETPSLLELLDKHHYLGSAPRIGRALCQVVTYREQLVGLLTWTHASYHLRGRDMYIGWDPRTRFRRLHFVVQNNRFLLLPKKRPLNLASKVLALAIDHLPDAWEQQHGHRPYLAETFVDPERYKGTCYKAAGWIAVGQTAGYQRFGSDYYQSHEHPKDLWLKHLTSGCLEKLRDPSVPIAGEKQRAANKMPIKSAQAESLVRAFRAVKDPR